MCYCKNTHYYSKYSHMYCNLWLAGHQAYDWGVGMLYLLECIGCSGVTLFTHITILSEQFISDAQGIGGPYGSDDIDDSGEVGSTARFGMVSLGSVR